MPSEGGRIGRLAEKQASTLRALGGVAAAGTAPRGPGPPARQGLRIVIRLKRVYEPASRRDGTRILVDRLWPRGVTKERAAVALWLKDVAPSTALRKWFGHDPARWRGFQVRYRKELREKKHLLEQLRQASKARPVTLVYGARDEQHNEALVLKRVLEGRR